MADRLPIGESTVRKAARVILGGGVIFYPTDTIYGLGCNAFDGQAIERVFSIKGRPENKPVLLLIDGREMLEALTAEVPPEGERLIRSFWPGPLTILFRAREGIHPLLTGSEGKVGVRLPDDDFCRRLLKAAAVPIVSTSANLSGKEGTAAIGDLHDQLGALVDLFIYAGDSASTLPSTVVDVTGERIRIVREGAIAAERIRAG